MDDEITLMVLWTTRREVEQVFAKIKTRWTRVARQLGADVAFVSGAMNAVLRAMPDWSAPEDLARVPLEACRDLKPLLLAVRDVFPESDPIHEALGHITDALAAGYWTGSESDTETHRKRPDGLWEMIREGGDRG